jgi:hypothetical protein
MARYFSLLCLCLVTFGPPANAQERSSGEALDYRFQFDGYFGGLKIGTGVGRLLWGGGHYEVNFNARSAGVLDWVLSINQTAESDGKLAKTLIPAHHRNHNVDGKKQSWIELAFAQDRVRVVDAKPDPNTEKSRSPVPEDLMKGVVDPLTGALLLGQLAGAADRCDGQVPVFDGRRRYDTVLKEAGREAYAGPAGKRESLICEFRFVRRAGYKADAKRWKGITGKVWLQSLADTLPLLPVRVQVETTYGTAIIHMVSAGPAR